MATVVGGGIAIAGSFVAQRYAFVLSVRSMHRDDLVKEAVVPWLEEVERLRRVVAPDGSGLASYAVGDLENGYRFRAGDFGLGVAHFPPDKPVWDQATLHWPTVYGWWREAQEKLAGLDREVEKILEAIREGIGLPPEGCEWQNDDPEYPGAARRIVAAKAWEGYWMARWQSKHNPERIFQRWFLHQDVWTNRGAQQALTKRLHEMLFGGPMAQDLRALPGLCESAHQQLGQLHESLQAIAHDRNLAGGCRFCPRFIQRA